MRHTIIPITSISVPGYITDVEDVEKLKGVNNYVRHCMVKSQYVKFVFLKQPG